MRNFGILLGVLAMMAFGLQACGGAAEEAEGTGTPAATDTSEGTATE